MRCSIRFVSVGIAACMLAALTACGDSSTSPSPQLQLTGTWSGVYGPSMSGTALRMTWEAAQTGNIVSGIVTLVKPAVGVQARGALTGTLDGDRLLLSYFGPSDSIPGFPRCSIGGLGMTTATNAKISGQLQLMFDGCAGTGLEPPANNELTLTR